MVECERVAAFLARRFPCDQDRYAAVAPSVRSLAYPDVALALYFECVE